jgi:hypothetical protein
MGGYWRAPSGVLINDLVEGGVMEASNNETVDQMDFELVEVRVMSDDELDAVFGGSVVMKPPTC